MGAYKQGRTRIPKGPALGKYSRKIPEIFQKFIPDILEKRGPYPGAPGNTKDKETFKIMHPKVLFQGEKHSWSYN